MEQYHLPYIVIFIPAYNEEKSIGQVIKKIYEKYVGNEKIDYVVEVIVIDDGSTDRTAQTAQEAGVKKNRLPPL